MSLIAVDPTRFEADDPSQSLDKWIGAPLQVGEIAARQDASAQIRDILGAAGAAKTPAPLPDAKESALDEPLTEAETQLLAALAPLAGPLARAVKRFINLYRLLRTQWRDRPENRGALAFMLALDAGGTPAEIAAVHGALAGAGGDAALIPITSARGSPRRSRPSAPRKDARAPTRCAAPPLWRGPSRFVRTERNADKSRPERSVPT